MNKHAKIAWWLTIVYAMGILGSWIYINYISQSYLSWHGIGNMVFEFALLLLLFGVFFLAFKRHFRIYAFLSFAWFCYSLIIMVGELQQHPKMDNLWYFGSILFALIVIFGLAYLSLRVAFASRMTTHEDSLKPVESNLVDR